MTGLHRQLSWAAGAGVLAIVLFAPERSLAALLLLLLIACPVLMVFLMRGMHAHEEHGGGGSEIGGHPHDGARGAGPHSEGR